MSFRVFLLLIVFSTAISWITWGMTLFYFNPEQIGALGFSLFYASLFLALSGSIFIVTDFLKARVMNKQLIFFRLRTSVRHSIFFSFLIVGWLFLRGTDLLTWWILLIFIGALTALEFFFISLQKQNNFYERTD